MTTIAINNITPPPNLGQRGSWLTYPAILIFKDNYNIPVTFKNNSISPYHRYFQSIPLALTNINKIYQSSF